MEGTLLMVQRATPPQVGCWSLPGGRVEAGETVTGAVEREVLEETALPVRCGPLVGWAERRAEGYHYVILDFAVVLDERGIPTAGSDAAAATWVPLAEVTDLILVEGLKEFLVEHGVLE